MNKTFSLTQTTSTSRVCLSYYTAYATTLIKRVKGLHATWDGVRKSARVLQVPPLGSSRTLPRPVTLLSLASYAVLHTPAASYNQAVKQYLEAKTTPDHPGKH